MGEPVMMNILLQCNEGQNTLMTGEEYTEGKPNDDKHK